MHSHVLVALWSSCQAKYVDGSSQIIVLAAVIFSSLLCCLLFGFILLPTIEIVRSSLAIIAYKMLEDDIGLFSKELDHFLNALTGLWS